LVQLPRQLVPPLPPRAQLLVLLVPPGLPGLERVPVPAVLRVEAHRAVQETRLAQTQLQVLSRASMPSTLSSRLAVAAEATAGESGSLDL